MIKISEERKRREKKEYSSQEKINGVMNTLFKRGFKQAQSRKIIYDYLAHAGQNMNQSLEDACVFIQTDFDSFIHFVREVLPIENVENKIEVKDSSDELDLAITGNSD